MNSTSRCAQLLSPLGRRAMRLASGSKTSAYGHRMDDLRHEHLRKRGSLSGPSNTAAATSTSGMPSESASFSGTWDTSESGEFSVHPNDGIGQEIKDENGLTVAWTVNPELAHRIVRLLNSE